MKKTIYFALSMLLIFGLVGCSSSETEQEEIVEEAIEEVIDEVVEETDNLDQEEHAEQAPGRQGGRMDFGQLAELIGVSEDEVTEAMMSLGDGGMQDPTALADALGVDVEIVEEAINAIMAEMEINPDELLEDREGMNPENRGDGEFDPENENPEYEGETTEDLDEEITEDSDEESTEESTEETTEESSSSE